MAVLALGASSAAAHPLAGVVRALGKPKPPLQGKKPVAVGTIAGPRSAKVRARVFERLKESNAYDVTDAEDLKPGAGKATIAKTAKALNVRGVIVGGVSKKFDLTLAVYRANGKLVREVVIKGGTPEKLENAVRREFDQVIGEPLAEATGGKNLAEQKPPPTEVVEEAEEEEEPGAAEEKPAKDEEKEEDKEEEEDEKDKDKDKAKDSDEKDEKDERAQPGRAPFELLAGIRGYNRQFSYTAAVSPDLLPYKLGFGPALLAGGRLYPAAFFRDDYSGNIGIIAQVELGIATSTDYVQDIGGGASRVTKLQTSAQEWGVGLVGRVPIDPVEIDVFGLYGAQTFILKGDEGGTGLRPLVPDVKYQYIRVGLEGRARVSKLLVSAHVAPRFLTSLHNIDLAGTWFPGATGRGLDAGLMLGWGFLSFLDVVAGFDFVRYGFDFNAIPNDNPKVAGGATDTYISGWLGVMIHLGGSDAADKH